VNSACQWCGDYLFCEKCTPKSSLTCKEHYSIWKRIRLPARCPTSSSFITVYQHPVVFCTYKYVPEEVVQQFDYVIFSPKSRSVLGSLHYLPKTIQQLPVTQVHSFPTFTHFSLVRPRQNEQPRFRLSSH
jgi:hypothetical protein